MLHLQYLSIVAYCRIRWRVSLLLYMIFWCFMIRMCLCFNYAEILSFLAQADLGSISSEIKNLQEQSMSMGIKLKNRKVYLFTCDFNLQWYLCLCSSEFSWKMSFNSNIITCSVLLYLHILVSFHHAIIDFVGSMILEWAVISRVGYTVICVGCRSEVG
jgi:hypothetical protein